MIDIIYNQGVDTMGKRHNLLTDDVFKNSKYIATINYATDFTDIRKEDNTQYKMILDIFKTFILLNNCFFSDSNLSYLDKVGNATNLLETLFEINDDESVVGVKYSVRNIKSICDKYCRHLYNLMSGWYYCLYNLSSKDVDNSTQLKNILKDIEKEMNTLEYVEFDSIVKDNITYQKNNVKNYKDYKRFICKFDYIYSQREQFISEFKEKYYKRTRIALTDDDIKVFRKVFTTITYGNNGLINTINNTPLDTKNLNEKSSNKYIYKVYLKLNGITYDSDTFKTDVIAFSLMLQRLYDKAKVRGINYIDVLKNFDMLAFLTICEETILTDEISFDFVDNNINGILLDLKDIYKVLTSTTMTYEEITANTKRYNEEILIKAYQIIRDIIERNKDMFMEVS